MGEPFVLWPSSFESFSHIIRRWLFRLNCKTVSLLKKSHSPKFTFTNFCNTETVVNCTIKWFDVLLWITILLRDSNLELWTIICQWATLLWWLQRESSSFILSLPLRRKRNITKSNQWSHLYKKNLYPIDIEIIILMYSN